MSLWLWIARTIAATILGLMIFVAFLSFVLVGHFTGKLLDVDTYTDTLNEQDAYNRLYDEVLSDPRLGRVTGGAVGGVQLVSQQEIVQIAKEIAPPDYLRSEVEKNLGRGVEYLNGQSNALNLEIDLQEPLARVESNIFQYIDQRIDELDTLEVDPTSSPIDQLAQVEELTNDLFWDIATGRTPQAVPSIEFIPASSRAGVFDSVLPSILNDPRIDRRVRQGLQDNIPAIRSEFIAGDTRQFLKEVAHAGLKPLIDQGIDQFNTYIDDQGHLDLIAVAAKNSDGLNEELLRRNLSDFRDQFQRVAAIGGGMALAVAILCTVLMFLIYLPSLINAMRWPGLTLLLTGAVLFVLGRILENSLPERLIPLVEEQIVSGSNLPASAVPLLSDLVQSFTNRLFVGLGDPALIILLLGALLFGGSFVVHLLRPMAPWIR